VGCCSISTKERKHQNMLDHGKNFMPLFRNCRSAAVDSIERKGGPRLLEGEKTTLKDLMEEKQEKNACDRKTFGHNLEKRLKRPSRFLDEKKKKLRGRKLKRQGRRRRSMLRIRRVDRYPGKREKKKKSLRAPEGRFNDLKGRRVAKRGA